jgi:hypothetical protein
VAIAGNPSTPAAPQTPEVVAGLRAGPALVITLYSILVVSAAVALGGDRFGFIPSSVQALAPIAFAAFVVLLAIYRLALVRARKYSAMKAFVQVGIGVAFLLLLMRTGPLLPANATPDPLPRLMAHHESEVRAMAAELARHRAPSSALLKSLVVALGDAAPEVRRAARDSLIALAGSDVGGDGSDAPVRWQAWVASQGN